MLHKRFYKVVPSQRYLFLLILLILILSTLMNFKVSGQMIPGAERTEEYLPLLKNKKMGLVINAGSKIKETLLVDSLLKLGVEIKKIFVPEHGFRGIADAGEALNNYFDSSTHLPVIALYGKHIQPDSLDLSDLDGVIFDLQDVGVRFYTYLSTLHYVMKACSHFGKSLLIFDRPNPNGAFIDGPVMDSNHHSFVGLHPVPILYGMTIGEYAQMISGENWIRESKPLRLNIIPIKYYRHNSFYSIPTPPSPNLPNDRSIALYPSLCLFEGTVVSIGRGTEFPFQVFGSPDLRGYSFHFQPKSIQGKSKHPLYENVECIGLDLRKSKTHEERVVGLSLTWLIQAYHSYKGQKPFFNAYFKKLAGNDLLQIQVEQGLSEKDIRKTWQNDLNRFKSIRKKYLLYP